MSGPNPAGVGAVRHRAPALVAVAVDADPLCAVTAALVRDRAITVVRGLRRAARECGAARVVLVTDGRLDLRHLERAWLVTAPVGDHLELTVRTVTAGLMVGEPTAVLNALRGAAPVARPLRSAASDPLDGAPAVVRHVTALVESLGDDGTITVEVRGAVTRPGIVRASAAASLTDLIDGCGGMRAGSSLQFALVGGATGVVVPADRAEVPLSWSGSGSRVVMVSDASSCVVDTVRRQLEVVVTDACGLCVVCREGSFQAASILADATTGRSRPDDMGQLNELGEAMRTGSLCEVGRGAGALVRSVVRDFGSHVEAHRRKRCAAGVCTAYLTFHVLPDLCTGCTQCLDVCLDEAIAGRRGYVHVVDQVECTKCGACLTSCPDKAVVTAGSIKPRTPARPVRVARERTSEDRRDGA